MTKDTARKSREEKASPLSRATSMQRKRDKRLAVRPRKEPIGRLPDKSQLILAAISASPVASGDSKKTLTTIKIRHYRTIQARNSAEYDPCLCGKPGEIRSAITSAPEPLVRRLTS